MFKSTGWKLDESNATKDIQQRIVHNGYELSLLKRFDFTSERMRASVLVADPDKTVWAYVKGAPERIKDLCVASSIPSDYMEVNDSYTIEGFRVIALSYKKMNGVTIESANGVDMKDVEDKKDLVFLGFLVMENKLKKETTAVIEQLTAAEVRCVMATGDNLHTAMSVARQCKIISDKPAWIGEFVEEKVSWKKAGKNAGGSSQETLPFDY
jgi:cation-transporting P-type ATPase 13A2